MPMERWIIVRADGSLILHEENDGPAFLRHGPQIFERPISPKQLQDEYPDLWNQRSHWVSCSSLDPAIYDLFGNIVDGCYWLWTEDGFADRADAFKALGNERAAAITERLATTTDDVPAQLMAEYQEPFSNVADPEDFDNTPPVLTYDAMIAEIGNGTFAPADATEFVLQFLCRLTGTRAS